MCLRSVRMCTSARADTRVGIDGREKGCDGWNGVASGVPPVFLDVLDGEMRRTGKYEEGRKRIKPASLCVENKRLACFRPFIASLHSNDWKEKLTNENKRAQLA